MADLRDNSDYYLHIEDDFSGTIAYNANLEQGGHISGGTIHLDANLEDQYEFLLGNENSSGEGGGLRYHYDWKIHFRFSGVHPASGDNILTIYLRHDTTPLVELKINYNTDGGADQFRIFEGIDLKQDNAVAFTDDLIYSLTLEMMDGVLQATITDDNGETVCTLVEFTVYRAYDGIDNVRWVASLPIPDAFDVFDFTMRSPEEPNKRPSASLTSPLNDAETTDTTPTFQWTYSDGGDFWDDFLASQAEGQLGFVLQLASSADFNEESIVRTIENIGGTVGKTSAFTLTTALIADTYYWRVKVLDRGEYIKNRTSPYEDDGSAKWSEWSTVRTLTVKLADPTATESSAAIDVGDEVTLGISGADVNTEYYMWDFGDGNESAWQTDDSIIYTYAADATYAFKVRYKDVHGSISEWSATRNIVVSGTNPIAIMQTSADVVPQNLPIVLSLINSFNENTNDTVVEYLFYSPDIAIPYNDEWIDKSYILVTFPSTGNYRIQGRVKDDGGNISDYTDYVLISVVDSTKTPTALVFDEEPKSKSKSKSGEFVTSHSASKDTYLGALVRPLKNTNERIQLRGRYFESDGLTDYETMRGYIDSREYLSVEVINQYGKSETLTGYLVSLSMNEVGGWVDGKDWDAEFIKFDYDAFIADWIGESSLTNTAVLGASVTFSDTSGRQKIVRTNDGKIMIFWTGYPWSNSNSDYKGVWGRQYDPSADSWGAIREIRVPHVDTVTAGSRYDITSFEVVHRDNYVCLITFEDHTDDFVSFWNPPSGENYCLRTTYSNDGFATQTEEYDAFAYELINVCVDIDMDGIIHAFGYNGVLDWIDYFKCGDELDGSTMTPAHVCSVRSNIDQSDVDYTSLTIVRVDLTGHTLYNAEGHTGEHDLFLLTGRYDSTIVVFHCIEDELTVGGFWLSIILTEPGSYKYYLAWGTRLSDRFEMNNAHTELISDNLFFLYDYVFLNAGNTNVGAMPWEADVYMKSLTAFAPANYSLTFGTAKHLNSTNDYPAALSEALLDWDDEIISVWSACEKIQSVAGYALLDLWGKKFGKTTDPQVLADTEVQAYKSIFEIYPHFRWKKSEIKTGKIHMTYKDYITSSIFYSEWGDEDIPCDYIIEDFDKLSGAPNYWSGTDFTASGSICMSAASGSPVGQSSYCSGCTINLASSSWLGRFKAYDGAGETDMDSIIEFTDSAKKLQLRWLQSGGGNTELYMNGDLMTTVDGDWHEYIIDVDSSYLAKLYMDNSDTLIGSASLLTGSGSKISIETRRNSKEGILEGHRLVGGSGSVYG